MFCNVNVLSWYVMLNNHLKHDMFCQFCRILPAICPKIDVKLIDKYSSFCQHWNMLSCFVVLIFTVWTIAGRILQNCFAESMVSVVHIMVAGTGEPPKPPLWGKVVLYLWFLLRELWKKTAIESSLIYPSMMIFFHSWCCFFNVYFPYCRFLSYASLPEHFSLWCSSVFWYLFNWSVSQNHKLHPMTLILP